MSEHNRLAFNGFEFDPAELLLCRDGKRVRLAPQPLRLLALLAGRPGQLVTRDEIRTAIWGTRAVEFDQALNYSIRQLRLMVDAAAGVAVIETVPRLGYRFVARIEKPAIPAASLGRPRVPATRLVVVATAAALLVATGLGSWKRLSRGLLIEVAVPAVRGIPGGDYIAEAFRQGLTVNLASSRTSPSDSPLTLVTRLEPATTGVRIRAELRAPGESAARWQAMVVARFDELDVAARDLASEAGGAAARTGGSRGRPPGEMIVLERTVGRRE